MRGGIAWRWALGALPLAAVLASGIGPSRGAGPARGVPRPVAPCPDVMGTPGKLVGSGSCSGTSCHGSIAPAGAWSRVLRNEHTTWITDDPHARAYGVLFDARSQEMVQKLAAGRAAWTPAHEDARCLACHATPRPPQDLAATARLNDDGIGCESCHGAASGWIGPHTEAAWRGKSPAEKRSLGMTETTDLARLAESCAGCHVGRRDDPSGVANRDMNHDLIAAGHPRLTFEFAAYLANEPSHWDLRRRAPGPGESADFWSADFPAKSWLVGQVAAAKSAAELLGGRAADPSAPWPELSESDCYACHHSLADQAWRRRQVGGATPPGQAEWASWFVPMTGVLAADPALGDGQVASAYEAIRPLMGRPLPDRAAAQAEAGKVAAALGAWLGRLDGTRLDVPTIGRLLETARSREPIGGWDHAAGRYLAMVPLRQGLVRMDPSRDDPKLRADLEDLLRALAFPPGEDGPGRAFDPAKLPD